MKKLISFDGSKRWMLRDNNRCAIRDAEGNILFFANKQDARKHRRFSAKKAVISPGPHHWRWYE